MGSIRRWWWSFQLTILLCGLASCDVVDSSAQPLSLAQNDRIPSHAIASPQVELDPVVEYLGPRRTMTLWQIPPGPVRRVLFIAAPRSSLPFDFWDRTPGCPLCTGLPEMRKIVLDALNRGYAVVSISPLNGDLWEAWPQDSPDLLNVITILSTWKETHGLENTPTVALGPSAGGDAVSTLGLYGPELFDSMVVMISQGREETWPHVRRNHYPPTLFVYMPRDSRTAEGISTLVTNLRSLAIPVDEVTWKPHPVTPTWFSELIPGLDRFTSRAIYDALKSRRSILDENDYLIDDVFNWQAVIRGKNILPEDPENQGQLLYKEAIDQEMKVAYAYHSTIARRNEEIFRWFDGDHDVRRNEKSPSLAQED